MHVNLDYANLYNVICDVYYIVFLMKLDFLFSKVTDR